MKLLGHPLHIMLIHFPSALLPMDFVCSLIAFQSGNASFAHAAFFALAGGVVLGILALITGGYDLIHVAENKPLALKTALIHGGINGTVIMVYCVLAFRAYKAFPNLTVDSIGILILKGSMVTLMIAGNYFGGSLILKHRVGISDQ
jgi:uncharacterized membrane protein